jgi:hypothetical protein
MGTTPLESHSELPYAVARWGRSADGIDGTITSNMAIVGTSNGSIDAYAAGLTDLVLDLFGYFAP